MKFSDLSPELQRRFFLVFGDEDVRLASSETLKEREYFARLLKNNPEQIKALFDATDEGSYDSARAQVVIHREYVNYRIAGEATQNKIIQHNALRQRLNNALDSPFIFSTPTFREHFLRNQSNREKLVYILCYFKGNGEYNDLSDLEFISHWIAKLFFNDDHPEYTWQQRVEEAAALKQYTSPHGDCRPESITQEAIECIDKEWLLIKILYGSNKQQRRLHSADAEVEANQVKFFDKQTINLLKEPANYQAFLKHIANKDDVYEACRTAQAEIENAVTQEDLIAAFKKLCGENHQFNGESMGYIDEMFLSKARANVNWVYSNTESSLTPPDADEGHESERYKSARMLLKKLIRDTPDAVKNAVKGKSRADIDATFKNAKNSLAYLINFYSPNVPDEYFHKNARKQKAAELKHKFKQQMETVGLSTQADNILQSLELLRNDNKLLPALKKFIFDNIQYIAMPLTALKIESLHGITCHYANLADQDAQQSVNHYRNFILHDLEVPQEHIPGVDTRSLEWQYEDRMGYIAYAYQPDGELREDAQYRQTALQNIMAENNVVPLSNKDDAELYLSVRQNELARQQVYKQEGDAHKTEFVLEQIEDIANDDENAEDPHQDKPDRRNAAIHQVRKNHRYLNDEMKRFEKWNKKHMQSKNAKKVFAIYDSLLSRGELDIASKQNEKRLQKYYDSFVSWQKMAAAHVEKMRKYKRLLVAGNKIEDDKWKKQITAVESSLQAAEHLRQRLDEILKALDSARQKLIESGAKRVHTAIADIVEVRELSNDASERATEIQTLLGQAIPSRTSSSEPGLNGAALGATLGEAITRAADSSATSYSVEDLSQPAAKDKSRVVAHTVTDKVGDETKRTAIFINETKKNDHGLVTEGTQRCYLRDIESMDADKITKVARSMAASIKQMWEAQGGEPNARKKIRLQVAPRSGPNNVAEEIVKNLYRELYAQGVPQKMIIYPKSLGKAPKLDYRPLNKERRQIRKDKGVIMDYKRRAQEAMGESGQLSNVEEEAMKKAPPIR